MSLLTNINIGSYLFVVVVVVVVLCNKPVSFDYSRQNCEKSCLFHFLINLSFVNFLLFYNTVDITNNMIDIINNIMVFILQCQGNRYFFQKVFSSIQ